MKQHKIELTVTEHDSGLWTVDVPTDDLGPVRQIELQANRGHCFISIALGDLPTVEDYRTDSVLPDGRVVVPLQEVFSREQTYNGRDGEE